MYPIFFSLSLPSLSYTLCKKKEKRKKNTYTQNLYIYTVLQVNSDRIYGILYQKGIISFLNCRKQPSEEDFIKTIPTYVPNSPDSYTSAPWVSYIKK